MGPPVIQRFGDMADPAGLLHTAEDKIIILRSVKLTAKTSCFFCALTFYKTDMSDTIDAAQQIHVKV